MQKQFVLALIPLLALAGILYFLFGSPRPLRLVEVSEAPRPPVHADPATPHLTLTGLLERRPETDDALRKRRNEIARAHSEALERWRAGAVSIREVEGIEMQLWALRGQVGEIEEQEMHARLAELLDRERQRLEALHSMMRAGQDQVERARLFVARERHLAGLPMLDPEGRDYETMRRAYLAAVKDRHKRLVDVGVGNRESLKAEYEGLQDEFPPVKP